MTEQMVPPPTDTRWLFPGQFYEPKRTAERRHQCQLPQDHWTPGLMWSCGIDGHLWVVRGRPSKYKHGYTAWSLEWWPASRWQRLRITLSRRGPARRARLFMATDDERRRPKPEPPRGPSGVSPKPGGSR